MKAFLLLAILLTVICVSVSASGATWYVDGAVSSSGDGKSWQTAVKTIQEAIDLAWPGDTVLVGSAGSPYLESMLDFNRKPITVRSEAGADATIVDCEGEGVGFRFHSGEADSSVLDGFTIRNARSGIGVEGTPGGDISAPTITNCKIVRNGDGIGFGRYSKPQVVNCTISANTYSGVALSGGAQPFLAGCVSRENGTYGMECTEGSQPSVVACAFLNNGKAGLSCDDSSPLVENSNFSGNEHGVVCTGSSKPEITSCFFLGNHRNGILCQDDSAPTVESCIVSQNGESGVYCDGTAPVVTSCLLFDNKAEEGGGLYCLYADPIIVNCTVRCFSLKQGAEVYCRSSSPIITNTVLWGDSERPMNWDATSFPEVTYSVVRNGWTGEGNIDADPQFRNFESGGFRLLANSPCVDAGNSEAQEVPETDQGGMHRIMFGGKSLTVDIGAYEFHIWPPTESSQTGEMSLKWSSLAGKTYTVYHSSDMLLWDVLADNVASAGDTVTTWIDPPAPVLPPGVRRRYYKVAEKPVGITFRR